MSKKAVALIAHDKKKTDLAFFARDHADILSKFPLVATSTTGTVLQDKAKLTVQRVLSGPQGGDLQIGAKIAQDEILAVIFFRDPLIPNCNKHFHKEAQAKPQAPLTISG